MTIVNDPQIQYRTPAGWVEVATGTETPTPLGGFPTATTVGVDAIPGWEPETVIEDVDTYMYIDEADAVYEDVRFLDTDVIVRAPRVTFRRCEIVGAALLNYEGGSTVANGMLFEDSTIRYTPPGVGHTPGQVSIGLNGFTSRRSSFLDINECFRVGAWESDGVSLLDPDHEQGYEVRILDSYVRITSPVPCDFDYHGDCLQIFANGIPVVIRNCAFYAVNNITPGCDPNSCVSATGAVDADGLIMSGAGYTMYLDAAGGDYSNLYFEDDSWIFGPVVVNETGEWGDVTTWDNVKVCTLTDGQPDVITGTIPFGWEGGPFDPP